MSVNVYLSEKVKESPRFNIKTHTAGSRTSRFGEMSIFGDSGRLYVMLGDSEIVPPELQTFVTDVSYYASIPTQIPRRERGVYVDGDSQAELEIYDSAKLSQYQVRVTAKTLDGARALIRKIKAGTIRPDESFEGAQQGLSRAELEAKLEETQRLLATATELATHLGKQHRLAEADRDLAQKRVEAAYKLAAELTKEFWPWCTKSSMTERIHEVINAAPAVTK